MSDDTDHNIIEHLEGLDEKAEQHFQNCEIRSAIRVAKESTRMAKSHQLAIAYMRGLFDQMRFGHGILDPQSTREVSVELVMLLQDEDQARRIQPALDEGHYHWLCSWMTSCAYDNLAEATGTISGYNSPGMHDCINDGIQVCRQTGKLECIKCFREYASDVYQACDDFEMVRHQCQSLLQYNPQNEDDKDRRWSGHHKLGKVLLLEGRVERAIEELNRALELSQAENVYLKRRAKLLVAATLDEAQLLNDKTRFDWDSVKDELPEAGEWPYFELLQAENKALAAVLNKDFESAIELLTEWDRRLTEQNCLKDWFEIRLRLIAAYSGSDQQKRADALAKGLEAKAHESQDYLTLRRLAKLRSEQKETSPIAGLGSETSESASIPKIVNTNSNGADSTPTETVEDDEVTPLGEFIASAMQRMMETEESESRDELLEEFLAINPSEIEDPRDAAYLVHTSQFLVQGTEQAKRVWEWARKMIDRFPDDAKTISVVAAIGHYFRSADPTEFEDITTEQLTKWFQLSASLNLDDPQNFARAARFHYDEGNSGEAERCYSRAFRLTRTDPMIVIPLADLYRETDRPRDALAVLDLSLREGCEQQEVAWEAGMAALQLEQFDSLLTYMDRFLELGEPQPWAQYYRALALWHQGKWEQSLDAIEQEKSFEIPGTFHLDVLNLCSLVKLNRNQEASELFARLMAVPFPSVDYLSINGLVRLLGQLWTTFQDKSENDAERQQLEHRLIVSGLMPDEYFDKRRTNSGETEPVFFYRIQIRQPLDESWEQFEGCLYGQTDWTEYQSDWGVLAGNEEDAVNFVLDLQSRCFHLPAEVVDVDTDEQEYRDFPGIAWQGMRWSTQDGGGQLDDELFSELDE